MLNKGFITTTECPVFFTGVLIRHIGTIIWPACITVFGASQFQLPEQQEALNAYFGIFYVAMNAAGLVAGFGSPYLRSEVQCFDEPDCYAIVNGLGTILVATALAVLLLTKKVFTIVPCNDNVVLRVSNCIIYALVQRCKKRRTEPRDHWMDYAESRYGAEMVSDIKILLRFVVLFIPFPIWFAMFEQISSRWTFQGTRMAGKIGQFTIYPDMMHAVNTLLVVIVVPCFQTLVYPMMKLCKMDTPVRRMVIGGLIMAAAFIVTGCLELVVQKTYPQIPDNGRSQLRMYNGAGCDFKTVLAAEGPSRMTPKMLTVRRQDVVQVRDLPARHKINTLTISAESEDSKCQPVIKSPIILPKGASAALYITPDSHIETVLDSADKSRNGYPFITVFGSDSVVLRPVSKGRINLKKLVKTKLAMNDLKLVNKVDTPVAPGKYFIYNNEKEIGQTELLLGGVYSMLIYRNNKNEEPNYVLLSVIEPNSVHILWQVPQYALITFSEVMFIVTGMHLAFQEAPESLKSVMQTVWILAAALGNIIIMVVTQFKVHNRAVEFFAYAVAMVLDMVLLFILALRYKPRNPDLPFL